MDCAEAKQYLSAYLDGCLPKELSSQLKVHLDGCAQCRAILASYTQMREQVRSVKLQDTDDFVWKGVNNAEPIPLYKKTWVHSLTALAACVVLVIGVLAVKHNGAFGPSQNEPVPETVLEDAASAPMMARMAPVPYAGKAFAVPENGVAVFDYEDVSDKQTYTMQIVTLSVSVGASEAFMQKISEIRKDDADGQLLVSRAEFDEFLRIDGVSVVQERTETTTAEICAEKIVIEY